MTSCGQLQHNTLLSPTPTQFLLRPFPILLTWPNIRPFMGRDFPKTPARGDVCHIAGPTALFLQHHLTVASLEIPSDLVSCHLHPAWNEVWQIPQNSLPIVFHYRSWLGWTAHACSGQTTRESAQIIGKILPNHELDFKRTVFFILFFCFDVDICDTYAIYHFLKIH